MSKLGSAPPPPPYKVPLSERLFGIGKLKPPATEDVMSADVDLLTQAGSTVRLGEVAVQMDPQNGRWQMDNRLQEVYQKEILILEQKVAQLEDERLSKNVYELEKRNIALEREKLALMEENNQLKFKNKVLMAMCTISEGDYKALCKEAGIEPRSQKKPAPAPAVISSSLPIQQQPQQPASSPNSVLFSQQQQVSQQSAQQPLTVQPSPSNIAPSPYPSSTAAASSTR